jgi:hypothetical protein
MMPVCHFAVNPDKLLEADTAQTRVVLGTALKVMKPLEFKLPLKAACAGGR